MASAPSNRRPPLQWALQRKKRPGSWLERVGRSALDSSDSEDLRLRKTLLMFASGLMNMAAIVWLAIYWVMGLKLPTTIPLVYQALSAIILAIYLKTRNFDFFRVRAALVVPVRSVRHPVEHRQFRNFERHRAAGAARAGRGDGGVRCARIDSLVRRLCRSDRLSGVFDYFLANGDLSGVPMRTVAVFFVLNFTILSSIVYLLLRYFVQQKDMFQAELSRQHELVQAEQRKSEQLLTTILPPHIAQRLKQDQATIADGFADVSVMFADIVNFTALAEELTPKEVVSFLDGVFTRFDRARRETRRGQDQDHRRRLHGRGRVVRRGDALRRSGGRHGAGDAGAGSHDDANEALQPGIPRRHRDRAGDRGRDRRQALHL